MKTILFLLLGIISLPMQGADNSPPFDLSIVPESQSATMASISSGADSKRPFYVVLTNRTNTSQPIFETWNSWGYQAISFDITLPDGRVAHVTKREQTFTLNFPSTYFILHKGHQVFPIIFNNDWKGLPAFKEAGRSKIKLKAIYTIERTPESKNNGIWEGSISSDDITVELNHW